jgi:hypothetical protein
MANTYIGIDENDTGNFMPEIYEKNNKYITVVYGDNAEWKGKEKTFDTLDEAKKYAYKKMGYEFKWEEDKAGIKSQENKIKKMILCKKTDEEIIEILCNDKSTEERIKILEKNINNYNEKGEGFIGDLLDEAMSIIYELNSRG